MTDGVTGAVLELFRRRLFTLNGAVALAGMVALMIGLLAESAVGRIVCGLIVATAAVYLLLVSLRRGRQVRKEDDRKQEESTSPGAEMKTLIFDDFQSAGGAYVVKELGDEETVVPSSRSTHPASVELKPETLRELEILDFFDLDSDEPYAESEPKSEFHSLVNKVLLVLKDVLFAHTVAFFWANREKNQMVLESMATESKRFMEGKRFPIEQDLVSQVAREGKPQIVGRINDQAQRELLRYYEEADPVCSVLCVPVFFRERSNEILPVGVIVADSKAEDAFGQETLVLMGRVTKLVSALIKSYTDKYDLLLDSELLTSLRRLQDRVRSRADEETVLAALADEAHKLAGWDCLTVTMYDEEKHGWLVQKVVNNMGEPYVEAGQTVDMSASLTGEVIRTNSVKVVDDLGTAPARFHAGELRPKKGSFVGIPVSSFNRCYGAVTLESRNGSHFSGGEVETLYRLVEQAGAMLEVLYMNDLAKDYVIIDHLTGSLTPKHFQKKLDEEIHRAEDFGGELSCVFFEVDNMAEHASRYGKDGAEAILSDFSKIIRGSLRAYDVLGRYRDDRFGVLLVNTAASDSYLWAEKIRKLMASHVVTVEGKSFSVTVSAGVCGLTEGMQAQELLAGTEQVLGKAVEKGGNLVRVY